MADFMQGGINAGMIANKNISYDDPSNDDVLKFDSTDDLWKPQSAGGGDATSIQGVDVCTTTPTDGQVLTYDLASTEWCPATAGGGGKILQVVTEKMDYGYAFPDDTFRATGGYASITPTSATNEIVIFSAVPIEGVGGYVIGQLDWYRTTSAMSSGDTLSGGTSIFVTDYGDANGKYIDWRTGGSGTVWAQPVVNIDVIDTTYNSTSEQFYNIVGREYNGGDWAIRGIPFSIIIMEIDRS